MKNKEILFCEIEKGDLLKKTNKYGAWSVCLVLEKPKPTAQPRHGHLFYWDIFSDWICQASIFGVEKIELLGRINGESIHPQISNPERRLVENL